MDQSEIPQNPQDAAQIDGSRGAYKEHLKEPFLDAFRRTGTIYEAAITVGLNRDTVADWRKSDPTFAADFAIANHELTERLESTAIDRAVNGVERKIFYKGAPVASEKEVSDSLLIFLLKSRAPEKYRESYEETSKEMIRFATNLSSQITSILRRAIPDQCVSCHHPFQFKNTVAQELSKLSTEI